METTNFYRKKHHINQTQANPCNVVLIWFGLSLNIASVQVKLGQMKVTKFQCSTATMAGRQVDKQEKVILTLLFQLRRWEWDTLPGSLSELPKYKFTDRTSKQFDYYACVLCTRCFCLISCTFQCQLCKLS